MKLLHKTGLYYLLATIFMYVIGSLAFYQFLRYQMRYDTIEKLHDDQARILKNLSTIDSISNIVVADNAIAFSRIAVTDTVLERFKDTAVHETKDNEINTYLQFQFKADTRLAAYKVVLTKSLAERENLIAAIAYSFLFLMAIFATGIFFINWWISEKVWGPFYAILNQLRYFNLQEGKFKKHPTDIKEFTELNAALETMTDKVKSDYRNLKEFTENASHEIQTPLAGINSKVELMLQNENLNENQVQQLVAIQESVNRLSRVNQSLLLLSKIENNQFSQTAQVDVREVLEKQIANLRELIGAKGLKLSEEITGHPAIQLHPYLLDILISNLLSNAIRHNVKDGFIHVKLIEHTLSIQNSGNPLHSTTNELFNRFKKDNATADSTGLGLSIVRKICDANNLRINYTCLKEIHLLTLHF